MDSQEQSKEGDAAEDKDDENKEEDKDDVLSKEKLLNSLSFSIKSLVVAHNEKKRTKEDGFDSFIELQRYLYSKPFEKISLLKSSLVNSIDEIQEKLTNKIKGNEK